MALAVGGSAVLTRLVHEVLKAAAARWRGASRTTAPIFGPGDWASVAPNSVRLRPDAVASGAKIVRVIAVWL